jgi:hypothetical protein
MKVGSLLFFLMGRITSLLGQYIFPCTLGFIIIAAASTVVGMKYVCTWSVNEGEMTAQSNLTSELEREMPVIKAVICGRSFLPSFGS